SRTSLRVVSVGPVSPAYCAACAAPIEFGAVLRGEETFCSVECSLGGNGPASVGPAASGLHYRVGLMRRLLLWCAQNRWLASHVPRWRFARRAVRRFLPGEGFDAALKAATDFKAHGVGALFTLLGENITDLSEANKVIQHYEEVLAASTGIDAEISVKPTQLGLDIDAAAAYENLHRLALAAAKADSFVWIDMEGSGYTDRTLDLYRRLRQQHPHVGV